MKNRGMLRRRVGFFQMFCDSPLLWQIFRESMIVSLLLTIPTVSACRENDNLYQQEIAGPCQFSIDPDNRGLSETWFAPGYDRTGWHLIETLGNWDEYGLQTYDGIGWYACTFELPPLPRPEMALVFSGIDDTADVWVNGAHVGRHQDADTRFVVNMTGHTRQGGNLLVVRIEDAGGPGGLKGTMMLRQFENFEELQREPDATLGTQESSP